MMNTMFKFPKLIEVVAGIIKIAKSIEADDCEKEFGGALQQWALRGDSSQGKLCSCHGWNAGRWFYATKTIHVHTTDGIWECGFVLPRQIMLMPWTEC